MRGVQEGASDEGSGGDGGGRPAVSRSEIRARDCDFPNNDIKLAMTDRIDRSPDKQILRGRIGAVHSRALHGGEDSGAKDGVRILRRLPKVVFVKFANATWQLPSWWCCALSGRSCRSRRCLRLRPTHPGGRPSLRRSLTLNWGRGRAA